jgi:hypothetical protein
MKSPEKILDLEPSSGHPDMPAPGARPAVANVVIRPKKMVLAFFPSSCLA